MKRLAGKPFVESGPYLMYLQTYGPSPAPLGTSNLTAAYINVIAQPNTPTGSPSSIAPPPNSTSGAPVSGQSNWSTFHGDAGRGGVAPLAAFGTATNYVSPSNFAIDGSPVVLGTNVGTGNTSHVFVGDRGGVLHDFAFPNGGTPYQVWSKSLGGGAAGAFSHGAAPTIGVTGSGAYEVFIGDVGGTFYALNATSGATDWSFPLVYPSKVFSSPVVASISAGMMGPTASLIVITVSQPWSTLHVGGGASEGGVYAFNPDGSVAWHTLTHGEIIYAPALNKNTGKLYVGTNHATGETTGHFYQLDGLTGVVDDEVRVTGTTLDVTTTPAVDPSNGPGGGAGTVYFAHGDTLEGYTPTGGVLLIQAMPPYQVSGAIHSTPAINGSTGTLYFGDDTGVLHGYNPNGLGSIYAINFGTGAILNAPALATTGIMGSELYFGTQGGSGTFYKVTASSGSTISSYSWSTGSSHSSFGTSSPAIDVFGTIYAGSEDGNLLIW